MNTDTCSTLEYMSPESIKLQVYYKESDIYSFGVLMYEVLTEQDFSKKNGFEFITDIVQNNYRPDLSKLDSQKQL